MRAFLVAALAASALLALPSASAKDFGPGDIRVCNATRCVPIMKRDVVAQLGPFYYSGPALAHRRAPALGSPYYQLRFPNGYVTGIVAVELPVEVKVRHKAFEQGYRLRRWGPTRTRFTLIDYKTKTRIRIGDEIILTLEKIEAWLDRDRRPM